MKEKTYKIAITGPESTGKSTLAEQLALHYQTVYVPEYARTYLDALNRQYVEDDLLQIAKGQLSQEESLSAKAKSLLISDTELLVMKIWSEHAYQRCHTWILEQLQKQSYDLYLLMNIDLPWEFDTQREHPHLRSYFFGLYEDNLKKMQVNYQIISGNHQDRLQNAIQQIDRLLDV